MGRKTRIEYYGAIYHIIQRGNNKDFIFKEDEEKIELLKIIGEVGEIFDFHLLAYIVMDDHYHFVIKTHNIPISKIMHRINSRYAKYYNFKNKRKGSPFKGRYKSILVQKEPHLFRLIRYIHNNPVYDSICDHMMRYKWSSDIFYRMNVDNLVNISELLDGFSLNRIEAIEKYKELMDKPIEDYKVLKEEFEGGEIIGTEEFKKSLTEDKKVNSLDNILKLMCPTKIDYELIKKGSRKRYLLKYKYEYAYEALNKGYTTKEIGQNISITGGAIRKILNERND